jgi:hypothetical protein
VGKEERSSGLLRLMGSMECILEIGRKLSLMPSESSNSRVRRKVGTGTDDLNRYRPERTARGDLYWGQGWRRCYRLTIRAIGVSRHGEQKPDIQWAGLYGSGGDDLKYGFEPEVRSPAPSSFRNGKRRR